LLKNKTKKGYVSIASNHITSHADIKRHIKTPQPSQSKTLI